MAKKRIDKAADPNEMPFKPLSAREFLEFMPLDMTDEEKDEFAKEMEESAKEEEKKAVSI